MDKGISEIIKKSGIYEYCREEPVNESIIEELQQLKQKTIDTHGKRAFDAKRKDQRT